MNRKNVTALLTLAMLALSCSNAMAGSPGALDADFGSEGVTRLAYFKKHSPSVIGMVSLESGRTIVAANRDRNEPPAKNRELLYAVTSRGTADREFGVKGTVELANGTAMLDFAQARSGDLLVLESGARLRALDQNGVPDAAFASAGVLDLGLSARNCSPMVLAVQISGRIILAGSNQGAPCVLGITAEGKIDETFGDQGVRTFPNSRVPMQKSPGLAISGDDSILVGALWRPDPANPAVSIRESGVVKFTPNGGVDLSYGKSGLASLPFTVLPGDDNSTKGVNEIVATSDGGAMLSVAEGRDYACTRGCGYTSNGYYLDGTGRTSKLLIDLWGATDFSTAPDGRVVASQNYYLQAVVSRWTSAPALDPKFGGRGINYIYPEGYPTTEAVSVDAGGNVLLGGTVTLSGKYFPFEAEIFVTRFLGTDKGTSMPQVEMEGYAWERMDSSDRLSLVGTARPAQEMRAIDVAVERTNTNLRKRHICQWIRGRNGGYVTRNLRKGRCPNPVFIRAKGIAKWKLDIARGMRWGRHYIYARPAFRSPQAKPIQTRKSEIWDFSVVKGSGD